MPARQSAGSFLCDCILCRRQSPTGRYIQNSQRASHLNLARNTVLQEDSQVPIVRQGTQTTWHAATGSARGLSGGTDSISAFGGTGANGSTSCVNRQAPDPTHCPSQTAPPLPRQPAPSPAIEKPPRTNKQLDKAERHKRTVTAHAMLTHVESHCDSNAIKLEASPDGSALIEIEQSLKGLEKLLDKVTRNVPSVMTRKKKIAKEVAGLQLSVIRLHSLHQGVDKGPIVFDTSPYLVTSAAFRSIQTVAQAAIFLVIFFSTVMGISRRAGDLLLRVIRIILVWAFVGNGNEERLSVDQKAILRQIPRTLETAKATLDVGSSESRTTTFAVCPVCHANYPPIANEDAGPGDPLYQPRCTTTDCNADLLKDGKPVKVFVYHDFHDYLARLLSRPDIEKLMDDSCDAVMSHGTMHGADDCLTDVFDADYIRSFRGPDETSLFVDRPGSEGRYLFAFNHDYFAPDRNTHRGASASCGIISAACLNLPLDLRYRPENMYIAGIIPGPDKPHNTELNHYHAHVVNALRDSWERGVRYTKTALHPQGRNTRSALVLAVCDLPGAREFSQCAGVSSHHYCSRCSCYGRDTITNTDINNAEWKPKQADVLRQRAEDWKRGATQSDREGLFKDFGMRWTPLWHLPYWDPANMLVADPMHCLYEGLAHWYTRDVLQLTRKSASDAEKNAPAFEFKFVPAPEEGTEGWKPQHTKDVAAIHTSLCASFNPDISEDEEAQTLLKKLANRSLASLVHVYNSLQLSLEPSRCKYPLGKMIREDYALGLVEWRRQYPLTPHTPQSRKLVTPEVMDRITDVIRDIVTPSWLPSVPFNFGHAAAGSLKADEWRTMSTVHLPIALVSVWGEGTTHRSEAERTRLRVALDHAMTLFSAISLASMRTQTADRMDTYLKYIISWVSNLTKVFPELEGNIHRPNVHMAIHIYEFMRLFGPVHGWWCFPFERLIGHVQRLSSNFKFGQREGTMLHTFIRIAKLKFWLGSSDCPDIIKRCKAEYDAVFSEGGTMDDDETTDPTPYHRHPTPEALQPFIKDTHVYLFARHKHNGAIFCRSSTHLGNSLILFKERGIGSLVPGEIKFIARALDGKTFFAVHRQVYDPTLQDPYRHYPDIPASIYSTRMAPTVEYVDPTWVRSHYARWQLDKERCVVLDLSRD